MSPLDIIVDRTPEEKRLRVVKLRAELLDLGYAVVTSEWLARIPLARRVEAMAEAR